LAIRIIRQLMRAKHRFTIGIQLLIQQQQMLKQIML
jgi:hypothetical protein